MRGSTQYECGECHHSFRVPGEAVRDARLLMCPACGSIDLNLVTVERPPAAVWSSRGTVPAGATEDRGKLAS